MRVACLFPPRLPCGGCAFRGSIGCDLVCDHARGPLALLGNNSISVFGFIGLSLVRLGEAVRLIWHKLPKVGREEAW